MPEFIMPALGADMTEGTLVEWLVGPGDRVRRGDIVAVVDTAKSAIEVECFENGVIDRLLVETGTTVPVGTPLAVISPNGEATGSRPETPDAFALETPSGPSSTTALPTPPRAGRSDTNVTATPLVRHLAEQAGLDLSSINGSGPGGRITRADVRDAAAEGAAPAAAPKTPAENTRIRATPLARRTAAESGIDLATVTGVGRDGAVHLANVLATAARSRPTSPDSKADRDETAASEPESAAELLTVTVRRDTAARLAATRGTTSDLMARSKREVPHYYLSTTVDLGNAITWLRRRNRELPVSKRLVSTAVLLKATALAGRQVPELNGFWTDGGFAGESAVHLGVAVSLRGGGLVAPAIRDAADLSLADVMARLRDLVTRARTGRLRASETSTATITVTNLGDRGVEAVFGVIHPPQVALVGLGKVVERPWAVNGLLGVRPVMTATLSADHRATDGATGARFLAALDEWAQKPEEL